MSKGEAFSGKGAGIGPRLVARLGPHPSRALGLDLVAGDEETLGEWLIAACLLASRAAEAHAIAAFRRLRERGLAAPSRLASAEPDSLLGPLASSRIPEPEAVAVRLVRLSRALSDRQRAVTLAALAAGSLSLDELGGRLARLAPGFGRAAVGRFLRPLRARWPVLAELPLEPAAVAAAVHLGLIEPDLEPEAALARLARAIEADRGGLALCDVEAALERLGRAACLRDRPARCPLHDACPRRSMQRDTAPRVAGAGPDH